MSKVDAQIIIDAPAEHVLEVLAEIGGVYQWAAPLTTENSFGPEASGQCDIVGLTVIDQYRVEAATTWSVKLRDDKTLVHTELRYGLRFGSLGALANAPILRRRLKRSLEKGLERLNLRVQTGEMIEADCGISIAA